MKNLFIGLIMLLVIIVLVVIVYSAQSKYAYAPNTASTTDSSTAATKIVNQVTYSCDNNKTILATYQASTDPAPKPAPGEPPQPTGSVDLDLSDGRTLHLTQTISADGARYSNAKAATENNSNSPVFWNTGHSAFIEEPEVGKSYSNCMEIKANPENLPLVYADGATGFSIRYPDNFTVSEIKPDFRADVNVTGMKFTIDPAIATGTNLAADSYISVESSSSTSDTCSAEDFLNVRNGQTAQQVTVNDTTYSVASSTDAGAGNRYENWIYAIPGTIPCRAVHYFIHYNVLENYPSGAVAEFDKSSLLTEFNTIRDSLVVQ